MFEESKLPVISEQLMTTFMTYLTSVAGGAVLGNLGIHLFTAGPLPLLPSAVKTDFTEATFTGYGALGIATGPIINLPSGDGQGRSGTGMFACTADGGPSENILGYYILDTVADLAFSEYFETPIPIINAGDFISLTVVFPMSSSVPIN